MMTLRVRRGEDNLIWVDSRLCTLVQLASDEYAAAVPVSCGVDFEKEETGKQPRWDTTRTTAKHTEKLSLKSAIERGNKPKSSWGYADVHSIAWCEGGWGIVAAQPLPEKSRVGAAVAYGNKRLKKLANLDEFKGALHTYGPSF